MYPYNLKTKNTPIIAKERTKESLSADRRLLELLQMAKQEAALLEQKYTALLQEELMKEAETVLQTMVTDEKKHQRILREILFLLFSDTFEDLLEDMEPDETETKTAEELLEELLFTEMDDITFFRSLLSAVAGNDTDDELWHLIFEIITDKQNHTSALNHLYAKYMK
jgi:rubrerythrin